MSSIKLVCFSCRKEMTLPEGSVSRREDCPHCGADVHCCKNCDLHDPKAYNECREPQAERVQEKDRANYCDFFQVRKGQLGAMSEADKLKAAAEALFKK